MRSRTQEYPAPQSLATAPLGSWWRRLLIGSSTRRQDSSAATKVSGTASGPRRMASGQFQRYRP